jgi:acetylserotonin N-methyltransferase
VAADLTPPDPSPVLDLLTAFRTSKVMFAAVELGVFDALAAGPKPLAALAAGLKCDPDAFERLVGAGVMLGLLARTPDGGVANTPAAQAYLTRTSSNRMLGYVGYSDRVLWQLWAHLADAVREGTHRWKQTYGWDGPIFSHFFKDEAAKREFLFGMHGYGLISSPAVVNAVDLSRFRTFVDLGGATGHLTVAACRRWPNLRGVVFDLPEAIPLAREVVGETEVGGRIDIAPGDFFADPLPPGDVYALGRILHDWTEAKILTLLGKIHAALPTGGLVLIAEKVLHDDAAGPAWAVLQSLNMLVCTEGKERTLDQYEALLSRVGFGNVTLVRTVSPLDAVTAVKR